MNIRWLWFPAAIAVAVLLGVALGFLTDTKDDPVAVSTPTSTPAAASSTTEPDSDSPGTTTSTPDDDVTTTTTSTTAPPVIELTSTQGWTLLSNANGTVPVPAESGEQTALLIADIDGDGIDDTIIGSRRGPNAVQVIMNSADGWTTTVIEPDELGIEAGGVTHDIDSDGDLDIVFGGDFSSQAVWWWENPAPDFDVDRWTRRTIKNNGGPMHHDMVFADINGSGVAELIYWNQRSETPTLWAAEIPGDPKAVDTWDRVAVWFAGEPYEGLDAGDVDGDGDIDLVAAGRLFDNDGSGAFHLTTISTEHQGGRALMAELVEGGNQELIFDSGDTTGSTVWYELDGETWVRNTLRETTSHGHSLDTGDFDGDGDIDLLSAEMHLEAGDNARLTLYRNDGEGSFASVDLAVGMDNHESKFADLDGDGDLAIASKPFNWRLPRLDVWLNDDVSALATGWSRTVIDDARPDRAIFVLPGDLDGDGDEDLASGPYWYANPGADGGSWTRSTFGDPLNQVALVADLDGDGDLDAFGTQGIGSQANAELAWAQNNGDGTFDVLTNVPDGTGDFLQGATAGRFQDDGPVQVLLSWHEEGRGIQSFAPPPGEEATGRWARGLVSETSQDEQVSNGDIDGDGDNDIMLGTRWIENIPNGATHTLHTPGSGTPDRHRLVDMDNDGDLDVVVSYEDKVNGRVAWYEQGENASEAWAEHPIANVTMGLSLDVGDIDGDGDLDVVVGEHSTQDPSSMSLLVFENGGDADTWKAGTIFTGDEHHDGTILFDADGDGDLDIASIGWTHGRVAVYENPAN